MDRENNCTVRNAYQPKLIILIKFNWNSDFETLKHNTKMYETNTDY